MSVFILEFHQFACDGEELVSMESAKRRKIEEVKSCSTHEVISNNMPVNNEMCYYYNILKSVFFSIPLGSVYCVSMETTLYLWVSSRQACCGIVMHSCLSPLCETVSPKPEWLLAKRDTESKHSGKNIIS